jgi:LysR family transcriptional regulator, glycine cleavage system transcriptional activator
MPHHLPPLSALRAFEVAARTGSYSAAAIELGVTHGAVSKQIATLEGWLGQRLFVRAGQRMVATPHGRSFAREVSEAFDRIADAARRHGRAEANEVLHVNAPATFAMRWLIPRLPDFQRLHPRVEVRVSTSTTLHEEARGFDLAIRRGPLPWVQFRATKFLDEWNTLVASPALLRRQPLRKLADLAGHTILSTETRPGDWEEWLAVAGYAGPPPARRHRYDHFFVTLLAAIDGFGITIGPMPTLVHDVAGRRLAMPFPQVRVPRQSYFVLTPMDADKTLAMHRFVEWLIRLGSEKIAAAKPARRRTGNKR